MKVPLLVPVPPEVVTEIGPVAPVPTVALMVVALVTVKVYAAVPPKDTAVAPVKPVPVIVTTAPLPPLFGVKVVIVGFMIQLNDVALVAELPP